MRDVMNRETNVEKFLESANEALLESKRIYRRVELLSARCESLMKQLGGMGQENETLEKLRKRLDEERVREMEATRREMERYREVEEFIDQLEKPDHRTILRRRYLDMGLTWVQIHQRLISDGWFYSERQLFRMYRDALREAREIWELTT